MQSCMRHHLNDFNMGTLKKIASPNKCHEIIYKKIETVNVLCNPNWFKRLTLINSIVY